MTQRKIGRIETFYAPPRWLFVRVESEDGAVGWGEASLEGWAEAVDGVFEAFRDRFIGADPFNIEDIWQVGYRGGFYRGGPVLMSALAGLEQALWDLKGRALGLPAWQMLGGKVRDKVAIVGDDVIMTGGTLIANVHALLAQGAKEVYVYATHGVFCGGALAKFHDAPIEGMVITDTVPVNRLEAPPNLTVLPVAGLLAETIMNVFADDSVSAIFGGENQLF